MFVTAVCFIFFDSSNFFERFTYLIDPTDFGRGGSFGCPVTLCERALLARCWKYNSFANWGFNVCFSSGLGAVGLTGTGFEDALFNVSMKLYTTAFSEKKKRKN